MSHEELTYRERLAQRLFDVRWPKEGDICPPVYDATNKSGWLRVVDAALAAMRGQRTGEELYRALLAAGARWLVRWEDATTEQRAIFDAVAATFSAPPEPVGWPGGWSIANASAVSAAGEWRIAITDGHSLRAWVDGKTKDEARELARLTAWTIAKQQPVAQDRGYPHPSGEGWVKGGLYYASETFANPTGGISRTIYEDLKRDHAALLVANQQQRQDLIEANACLKMARFERDEAKEENATLRARSESCHDALMAAKAELTAFKDGAIEAQNGAATWAREQAALTLAAHITSVLVAVDLDSLLDMVPKEHAAFLRDMALEQVKRRRGVVEACEVK